jgi:hypothetical protein
MLEIYVENAFPVDDFFPKVINGIKIQYLDQNELKTILRKNKSSIPVIKIIPLKIINDKLFINVIQFQVTFKKDNFNYANGGGLSVYFIYNCETKTIQFAYSKVGYI